MSRRGSLHGIVVALEQRRGLDHRRAQFGHHRAFQARIAQHRAGGDPGAETDHQRRTRLTGVDQQRQQRLQAHVAQRWHGIAGIGHAPDVQAAEALPWRV
jgi:hypothetical protein